MSGISKFEFKPVVKISTVERQNASSDKGVGCNVSVRFQNKFTHGTECIRFSFFFSWRHFKYFRTLLETDFLQNF